MQGHVYLALPFSSAYVPYSEIPFECTIILVNVLVELMGLMESEMLAFI